MMIEASAGVNCGLPKEEETMAKDATFLLNCWYVAAWDHELIDGRLLERKIESEQPGVRQAAALMGR